MRKQTEQEEYLVSYLREEWNARMKGSRGKEIPTIYLGCPWYDVLRTFFEETQPFIPVGALRFKTSYVYRSDTPGEIRFV